LLERSVRDLSSFLFKKENCRYSKEKLAGCSPECYSVPAMKCYSITNPFKTIKLNVSRAKCFYLDGTNKISFNRQEAANAIRYARFKGSVSLQKTK
jgi:hypothetical protein